MSQSAATRLIPKLRYKLHDRRKLRNVEGPKGRHDKIKKTLTALLKHERIELNYHRGDETRGYAERLISEAIRNGDCHRETMEMASYWIIEPPIVHKLFKVLVPRYTNFDKSYTKMWRAPNIYPGHGRPKCVLELRNNIYPPLMPDLSANKNLIHNVLLEEAKKAYVKKKAEMAAKRAAMEQQIILEGEAWRTKTQGSGTPKVDPKAEPTESANVDKSSSAVGDNELPTESSTSEIPPQSSAKEIPTQASAKEVPTESSATETPPQSSAEEIPSQALVDEVSGAENLKADSVSKSESGIKSETDSSLEEDLSKMKVSEEDQKRTFDKKEKK